MDLETLNFYKPAKIENKTHFGLMLPADLKVWCDEQAALRDISTSEFIRRALQDTRRRELVGQRSARMRKKGQIARAKKRMEAVVSPGP